MSVSIVHAIEHASRSTTVKTVGRVAEALGVRAADLLSDEAGPRPASPTERLWRELAADLRERDHERLLAIRRLVRAFDDEVSRAAGPSATSTSRRRGRGAPRD